MCFSCSIYRTWSIFVDYVQKKLRKEKTVQIIFSSDYDLNGAERVQSYHLKGDWIG